MPDEISRKLFITPAVLQAFESLGNLRINNNTKYERESMAQLLAGCHICVTGWGCPPLDEYVLKDANDLRLVIHTGGTVADLATAHLYDKGVRVISGNEIFAESVAEGTLAYMLAALRRIPFYNKNMQAGLWRGVTRQNKGLLDKKIGLVGFGAIPRYLVPMLKPFRADIQVYDPFVGDDTLQLYSVKRAASLESLFAECDIVSNHLPLTTETTKQICADLLNLMRPGTLFVNTARGSTVDEQALETVLQNGQVHAVLDVFEVEPLPLDSKLMGLDNVILIPHMGGPTADRYEMVGLVLADACRDWLAGQPLTHEIPREYAAKMTSVSMAKKR